MITFDQLVKVVKNPGFNERFDLLKQEYKEAHRGEEPESVYGLAYQMIVMIRVSSTRDVFLSKLRQSWQNHQLFSNLASEDAIEKFLELMRQTPPNSDEVIGFLFRFVESHITESVREYFSS